jgi:O-methyltransferase
MKKAILRIIEKMGYSISKIDKTSTLYPDIREEEFWDLYHFCRPYTMTSVERMYALYCSVNHILLNNIDGDFVECGVWRGGSSMLVAKMLSTRNLTDRKIYLFDTFEGMSEPTKDDVDFRGESAFELLDENQQDKEMSVWALAEFGVAQNNMKLTNFPMENILFVKGMVENTLPGSIPDKNIALLRLDTDWYESTKHELTHLFPIIETNGIIIIDDYGHWEGCRKAVDDYFRENKINILLNRIDYTGRIGVKTTKAIRPASLVR